MASIRNEIALRAPAGPRVGCAARLRRRAPARRARLPDRQQARWDDVRVVTFANGMVARETLVSSDDQQRRLVYAIMDQRFKHYSASVQVFPEASGSRLVWLIDLCRTTSPATSTQMAQAADVAMKKTLEAA